MQLHPNDLTWNREVELLKKHSVIGLGDWDEAAKQQPNFENVMQIGDYVMIKHGGSLVALVQVESDYYKKDEDVDDLLWFQKRRKVKVLDWYNDQYNYSVTSRKTLEKCINPSTGTYKSIMNWIYRIENRNNMNKIVKFLEANHNLILTGAPGTGKTYLAKQIAAQIILGKEYNEKAALDDEKKRMEEQCGFVQFHPSYDYTDFVEGLRPIQDENGNVGFERRDGVLKAFCERALKSSFAKGSDNFDEVWDKLISYLDVNPFIEIPLLTGARNIRIELNEYGTGLTERLYSDKNASGEIEKVRGHSKFFTKEQLYNVYRGLKGVPSGGHDNYRKAIIEYLKKNMGLVEYSAGQHSVNDKKFVFIIDEINRGDISKIFGELFFSIDPGYRGMDGAVRTQYANMQTSPNEFDIALKIEDSSNCGHFFVPENVYIIGTMNDIDRSVESMDFAMRRRFAFKEICAEDRMDMIKENSKLAQLYPVIEQRMRNLNLAILTIQSLSTAYQIGAAYYLKLENYLTEDGTIDDSSWKMLWDNHLHGLLFEYLRGLPNEKKDLNTLHRAYNLEDRYEIKDGKPEKVKDNA
jgi:5-methylcytosine-specific restriction endonuclease McrBC GTP-binding regulatory subunit McrB